MKKIIRWMGNIMNSQEKDLEEPGHVKSKVKIMIKMRIMKKRIIIYCAIGFLAWRNNT